MLKQRAALSPLVKVILIAVITLSAVGLGFAVVHFVNTRNEAGEPVTPVYPDDVYGVPVYTELMPEDLPGRTGVIREIKYIVIHETGNTNVGANAQRHSEYLLSGKSGDTSWHYTVDDSQIYHHVPDNEIAFHAGDTHNPDGGNAHGIGIELCVNADGDYEKTLDNGAKLVAYLMKAYDLDIDAVTQHADYMEKNCPQQLRDSGRWDEFLGMIETYYEEHSDD